MPDPQQAHQQSLDQGKLEEHHVTSKQSQKHLLQTNPWHTPVLSEKYSLLQKKVAQVRPKDTPCWVPFEGEVGVMPTDSKQNPNIKRRSNMMFISSKAHKSSCFGILIFRIQKYRFKPEHHVDIVTSLFLGVLLCYYKTMIIGSKEIK